MIPFTDFNGHGPNLHFLHANGYPPACYLPLIENLKNQFHVSAMHLRPLWPDSQPKEIGDWLPLSADLLAYLKEQGMDQTIGVGHSIGATVSLRAALLNPEKFSHLILIDPVLFPPRFILTYNLVKALGLAYRTHPLILSALKRRRTFDDLETLYQGYRRRKIFRFLSDEALRILINGLSRPSLEAGFELIYSPEWEARIYYTGIWRDLDLWRNLSRLKIPTLIIRGAETDTFLAPTARRVEKANPAIKIVTLEKSTHLVPLEKPDEVASQIFDFVHTPDARIR